MAAKGTGDDFLVNAKDLWDGETGKPLRLLRLFRPRRPDLSRAGRTARPGGGGPGHRHRLRRRRCRPDSPSPRNSTFASNASPSASVACQAIFSRPLPVPPAVDPSDEAEGVEPPEEPSAVTVIVYGVDVDDDGEAGEVEDPLPEEDSRVTVTDVTDGRAFAGR